MLQKDKENLELKLQRLKDEAKEDFFEAQQIFLEEYEEVLEWLLSRENFWLKSRVTAYFEIMYVDRKRSWISLDMRDIFQKSLEKALNNLPLSPQKKQALQDLILKLQISYQPRSELYHHSEQLIHDPYFPLIEDIAIDGGITKEEFLALEFSYMRNAWDMKSALDILSPQTRALLRTAIDSYENLDPSESEALFRQEYSSEIQVLEKKWEEISHTLSFIARSYYKNPGRYKKYEHPKRRLKRTMKLALLRLLRKKLGNIDAESILERFENGETFLDFFTLIFEILEILPENPQGHEVYTVSNSLEEAEKLLSKASSTQEKILSWQKLTTSVSSLISKTDAELDSAVLTRILNDSTDFVWEEIHFRVPEVYAWILSEWKKTQLWDQEKEDDEEKEEDYSQLSVRWAFEAIKEDFSKLEREKTKAFLEGRYEDIDLYNERLFTMQRKLEKLAVILWEEL